MTVAACSGFAVGPLLGGLLYSVELRTCVYVLILQLMHIPLASTGGRIQTAVSDCWWLVLIHPFPGIFFTARF